MGRYQDTLITTVSVPASTPAIDNHPYVPALRVQADYSQAQKDLIRTYNSLRAKVIEAGLMEDKS